jgi:hypothetical protein
MPLEPSLMLASKARAFPSEAPFSKLLENTLAYLARSLVTRWKVL